MAKSKPKGKPKAKPESVKTLSDEQLKELGDRLVRTSQNIYTLSQAMFGLPVTQNDWDRLEKLTGLFRCSECITWKGNKGKDGTVCQDCLEDNWTKEDDIEF